MKRTTPNESPAAWGLKRAMAHLSREKHALLFLRYRLDVAPQEISEVLSLRLGTVKSRLHRGVRRLQAQMAPGPRGGD